MSNRIKEILFFIIVLMVTFFVYFNSLKSDFTNYDDDNHITKNEDIKILINNSDILTRSETGLISNQEFFEEFSKICGLNISYDELKEIYSKDKFTPVEGTEELIRKLQKKYKIGLLSNTSSWDYDYILISFSYYTVLLAILLTFVYYKGCRKLDK